jgi:hypothetical protein
MNALDFKHRGHLPILFKSAPHSKVLEPVCLFHSYLSPIVTLSPRGEGGVRGFRTLFIRVYLGLGTCPVLFIERIL